MQQSLAFADVRAEAAVAGTELSVLILGDERRAVVLDAPVFDPDNSHLRD